MEVKVWPAAAEIRLIRNAAFLEPTTSAALAVSLPAACFSLLTFVLIARAEGCRRIQLVMISWQ